VKIEIKSEEDILTGPFEMDKMNKIKELNKKNNEKNTIRFVRDEYLNLFNCVLNI
jgi:hypothetical protein|tara:strand:- start:21 stop:185 length:165 start_codon:yes stop_codon:yes gene_type:complete